MAGVSSLRWRGKDAIKFVESVTVADVQGLAMNTGTLSVIPNDKGGIIDDTMITKTTDAEGDHIYQVSSPSASACGALCRGLACVCLVMNRIVPGARGGLFALVHRSGLGVAAAEERVL